MFPLIYIFGDWGITLLRVVLGLILIVHGWPKLRSLKKTAESFGTMGFRPGGFWALLVTVVEFFGGLALILGLYVQVAAPLVAVEFLVINIWKLAKRQSFVSGWEFDLLILAAALAVFTLGSGALSLDRFLFWGGL